MGAAVEEKDREREVKMQDQDNAAWINVIIGGSKQVSVVVRKFIAAGYNPVAKKHGGLPIRVVGFLELGEIKEQVCEGVPVLTLEQCAAMYQMGIVEAMIMPREYYADQTNWIYVWNMIGISLEDVYITGRIDQINKMEELDILDFFMPYYSSAYLPYLEYHIADHCNLNCAACEHYSGLVEGAVLTDYEKFEKDFIRLSGFIEDIGSIRILGGEPLLNPDIEKFIRLSRKLYPESDLFVVTNGLLLDKMPDSFYETLNQEKCYIWVSYYPPLQKKKEQIEKLLKEKKVGYGISDLNTCFTKKQVLQPGDDAHRDEVFVRCYQHSCHNLYEGKLSACFLPFTTKYFNAAFQRDLPEDGALDLYADDLSVEKIKHFLTTPFERCRYCDVPEEVPWSVMHRPIVIEDWVKSPA